MDITGYWTAVQNEDSEQAKRIAGAILEKLASDPKTPAELFGLVGDIAMGVERDGNHSNGVKHPDDEAELFNRYAYAVDSIKHKPGDYGIITLSSPTSIVMFQEAEQQMMEAAIALRELYADVNPDFSSEAAIEKTVKSVGNAVRRWQEVYGDDLIMQDQATVYTGTDAVAESYMAKKFKIRKSEALGALNALVKWKFPEQRVYRTNDELPMGRLVIVNCMPQVETDPKFYFVYRIPKDNNVNGPGNAVVTYAAKHKKAA